jgi:hypothetical protein
MKTALKNISFIIIVVLVGYILFLRQCKSSIQCPPAGQILISKVMYDSIKAITNRPPIVTVDTIREKSKTVYVTKIVLKYITDKQDSTIKHFTDSTVNNEINFHIGFSLVGRLLSYDKYYTPIRTEIVKTVTVFVPKIIDHNVPVSKSGLWLNGTVGGNESAFLPGGGITYITKKNTEIGLMYQRFGNENFYSIRAGIPIRF